MKKLMLSLVLALIGLGLSSDVVARCHRGSCKTECASKCAPKCGVTTYSEEGCPVCIKAYTCERSFPANAHIHKTYSCPVDCQVRDAGYQCKTQLEEVPSNGSY
jgi:hypothetical protein